MKSTSHSVPGSGPVLHPSGSTYAGVDTTGDVDAVVVPRGPMPSPDAWSTLVAGLPAIEQQRIGRVCRGNAQLDSAVGWSLLTELAARHDVSLWRNSIGRPVSDPPVDLSMSHGGGWVAAAASRQGRVGVDVEPARVVSPALARRCLSAAEIVWLDYAAEAVERQDRFTQLWTAKEAYLKAIGTGLGTDPRSVTIDCSAPTPRLSGDVAGRWQFHSWTVDDVVRVTVCEERPS